MCEYDTVGEGCLGMNNALADVLSLLAMKLHNMNYMHTCLE